MGGSKLLSALLLVAALCYAPASANLKEERENIRKNDPIVKGTEAQTIPANEVEITEDDQIEHAITSEDDPGTDKDGNVKKIFTGLIKHGSEVVGSKFPYIVTLQRKHYNTDRRYHFCAAVLLDQRTALTAAHCIYYWKKYNKYYEMWAGVGFVKLTDSSGTLVKVVDSYVHPKYTGYNKGYPNDLAVVVFDKEVVYSSSIMPANLTASGQRTWSNWVCELAGWGYDEDYTYPVDLNYVKQYWLSNYQCKLLHKPFWWIQIRYKQMCTYYPTTSPCYGDSGGPVVCDNEVSGIISSTVSCSGCYGAIHTRVSGFRDWIADMQQKASDDYFS